LSWRGTNRIDGPSPVNQHLVYPKMPIKCKNLSSFFGAGGGRKSLMAPGLLSVNANLKRKAAPWDGLRLSTGRRMAAGLSYPVLEPGQRWALLRPTRPVHLPQTIHLHARVRHPGISRDKERETPQSTPTDTPARPGRHPCTDRTAPRTNRPCPSTRPPSWPHQARLRYRQERWARSAASELAA